MEAEKALNDTAKAVGERLMSQAATIDDVARHLGLDPRSVYRALNALKKAGYQVIRFGEHGSYVWEVRLPEEQQSA
jgi:DNA-binding IclR family transcriptional regulator